MSDDHIADVMIKMHQVLRDIYGSLKSFDHRLELIEDKLPSDKEEEFEGDSPFLARPRACPYCQGNGRYQDGQSCDGCNGTGRKAQ